MSLLSFNKSIYNKDHYFHKHLLTMIVIISVLCSFFYLYKIGYISYIFTDDHHNLHFDVTDNYFRQTKALANGSFSFLEDASNLEQLENPYDIEQRKNVFYLWDTSYYKGKYYSYFTVLPIVFILLPIYKIFGVYLHLAIVNLLILGLALFVISKLYQKMIEKYFPNLSFFVYILGFLTIIFGSNILILMRGLKYDIPISCGILSIFSTLYFLFSISKKNQKLKIILAGIFTAFIVCSKPTYVVYYPLIFYLGYKIYKKNNLSLKHVFLYFLPCVIIGLLQMWYNYMRYESIFEFGARYQLTGFNLYNYMHFSFSKTLRGLKAYLFQLPKIDIYHFPYIFMIINPNNSLYSEFLYEWYILGLASFPVFIYSFFLTFKKEKDLVLKNMKKMMFMVYSIFLMIVILNCSVAGVSETYSLEFKSLLMFISVIFLLRYYELNKNIKYKRYMIIGVFLLNILLILPISFCGEDLIFVKYIQNLFIH